MDGIRSIAGWGLGGLLVLCALVAAFAIVNRRDQHVGVGEEIQFDDFAFSVTSVSRPEMVGPEGSHVRPHGTFVVVKLRVMNRAKRVDYRFDRSFGVLEDADGDHYFVSPEGQAALEAATWTRDPCADPIPAGAECETLLVYDVPPDAHGMHLRIRMEASPLLFLIDLACWGDKWIRID